MTKKYITDLSTEELTKVFENNKQLQYEVREDMIETEMHWIEDQLEYFKHALNDWNINSYDMVEFTVDNEVEFINGVARVEDAIPILIDKDLPILNNALEAVTALNNHTLADEADQLDGLEEAVSYQAMELKIIIEHRWGEALDGCSEKEHQLDYFLEFYTHHRMDDCFIESDDPSYELKELIVRSYL